MLEYGSNRAIQIKLDDEEIFTFYAGLDSHTEFEKFERSKKEGDPIHNEHDFCELQAIDPFELMREQDEINSQDFDELEPERVYERKRSASEDNICVENRKDATLEQKKKWY